MRTLCWAQNIESDLNEHEWNEKQNNEKKRDINGNFLTNLWNESQYDLAVKSCVCVEFIFSFMTAKQDGCLFVQFYFVLAYISIGPYVYRNIDLSGFRFLFCVSISNSFEHLFVFTD